MSSTDTQPTVSLIIPVFNEEAVLPVLIDAIEMFRSRRRERINVLFVDDGSTDGSAKLIRGLTGEKRGFTLVRFSRNFGHQLAVTAGLDLVDADAAIIMDADLQDPLDVAGQMIDRWKEGFDVVYGIRRNRAGTSYLKKNTALLFYRIFRRFTDVNAPLDAGDFRLVSRRVIDAYKRFEEQQPYVRGLIAWLGFNQTGIEYDRPARAAGEAKYTWGSLMRLAFDGLASFSGRPLRYAVRLGLAVSALSVAGLLWVLIIKYVVGTTVSGWASLIFVGFFFGGLQLFFLGVVGSYVARVYEEVKARPRFIIRETFHSDDPGEQFNPEIVPTHQSEGKAR